MAGAVCTDSAGKVLGDSEDPESLINTELLCAEAGASWNPYTCQNMHDHMSTTTSPGAYCDSVASYWSGAADGKKPATICCKPIESAQVRSAPRSEVGSDAWKGIKTLLARAAHSHRRSKASHLNTRSSSGSSSKTRMRTRPLRWSPRMLKNKARRSPQAVKTARVYKPASKQRTSRARKGLQDQTTGIFVSRAGRLQNAIAAIRQGR